MARFFAPVLALLLAVPALADTHETQTVELVQVPVYVSSAGSAVGGLTQNNFELRVNGKPQPIEYFDVIDFATVAGAQQRVDPKLRRVYVFVFDLFYSSMNEVHRAQVAAEKYLNDAGPADVFAIASYTPAKGLGIIVPFTRDRLALRRAIAGLNFSSAADPLHLQVMEARDRIPANAAETLGTARALRLQARTFAEDQIVALRELGGHLAPIEGQKHVVLLSSGFETTSITGSRVRERRYVDIRNAFLPNNPMLTTREERGTFSVPNTQALLLLRQLSREYASASVFLDAIDIAGIRPYGNILSSDSLYAYADATGGSVVNNDNDLLRAMQVLTDEQRIVYILSFRATDAIKKQNTISVRLRGVDGNPEVHYRQSFTRTAEGAGTDNALHLADILLNDTPQTGISVQSAVTTNGRAANVAVTIGGPELAAQIEGNGVADVMLYVFSGETAVAFDEKKIDIDMTKAGESLRRNPIRFDHEFRLPPGSYSAKVLVRLGDNALGFSRTDFTIP